MPHTSALIALSLALLAAGSLVAAARSPQTPPAPPAKKPAPVLNFTMKDIDGKAVDLSKYQGKVILMVNVASKCGYTPQYKDLEAIYKKYSDQGLVILGFPANEFGQQEPGSDSDIKTFCTDKYNVTFPMFSKVVVKGEGQCPLYKFLTSSDTDPKFAGDIKWNFTKFLIARDGSVVNRFEPKVNPSSEEATKAIEAELAKKAS